MALTPLDFFTRFTGIEPQTHRRATASDKKFALGEVIPRPSREGRCESCDERTTLYKCGKPQVCARCLPLRQVYKGKGGRLGKPPAFLLVRESGSILWTKYDPELIRHSGRLTICPLDKKSMMETVIASGVDEPDMFVAFSTANDGRNLIINPGHENLEVSIGTAISDYNIKTVARGQVSRLIGHLTGIKRSDFSNLLYARARLAIGEGFPAKRKSDLAAVERTIAAHPVLDKLPLPLAGSSEHHVIAALLETKNV